MKKGAKRGQITLFIILGIIILVMVFTIFYLRSQAAKKGTEMQLELPTQQLPDWAQSVQIFVEDCMQEVAIEAFKKVGEHGGYIDFDDYEIVENYFNIDHGEPTESDAVSLSTLAYAPTAYWWYMPTSNLCDNCTVDSLMPNLSYIEQQLNRYMDRELLVCLDNFNSFKDQYFEFSTEALTTTTSINLDDVDVTINYPVTVKLGDSRTSMDKFRIRLDLDFYHTYLLAYLITGWEVDDRFLEDITLHLMGVYSPSPDSDKVPPIAWVDNKDSTVRWDKDDVKERINRNLIGSNLPLLQVNNTRDAKHIKAADPIQQGVYDVMFLDFLAVNFTNSKVNFFYNPDWAFHFDITPSSGSILEPLTVRTEDDIGFFPTTTTNYYEFFYDLSFPVIVIIEDSASLKQYGEEGYTFMFALEANIRDNKDLYLWNQGNGTIGLMDYSGVSIEMTTTNSSATACIENSDSTWTCPLDGQVYSDMMECGSECVTTSTETASPELTETLFGDYEQRIYGNITIRTFDAVTADPLPEVAITFCCGNYMKTPMEQTDDNGIYNSAFPYCLGQGYILLDKTDYMSGYVADVSTHSVGSVTYDVYLEQIREKEVEAYFINVTNMFRIKRWLLPDTGSGILEELYYRILTGYDSSGKSTYDEFGILQEIESAINALVLFNPSSLQLSSSEAAILISQINFTKQEIIYAESLVEDYEYWYEVERENVAEATLRARDAAETARQILTNPAVYIGDRFKGDITIGSDDDRLNEILISLNHEIDNVQFLSDSEVNDASNIDNYVNKACQLRQGDYLTITYEKIKESMYEQNLPVVMTQLEYGESSTISLVPGEYDVSIIFRNDDGIVIPASGFYVETDYTPALLGGVELDNQSSVWGFTKTQLDSADKIRFHIFKIDDPETIEDISETGAVANYSQRYRAYVEPIFLP